MEELSVLAKSPDTAHLSPIILKETKTTRLVFKPMLTNSKKDRKKPLEGVFCHQRKRTNDDWEDAEAINLAYLKAGEGVRLEIGTLELHKLKEWFDHLYQLYNSRNRLPASDAVIQMIATDRPDWMEDLEQIGTAPTPAANLAAIVSQAVEDDRASEVADALAVLLRTPDSRRLVESLSRLDVSTVEKVNTLSGVARMKDALAQWQSHRADGNEKYWQSVLKRDSFVFSQVFSFPVILFQDEAYLGGKATTRKGGKLLDFLLKTKLTDNALLVEIKTPSTALLGQSEYRGMPQASQKLVGSVAQVSNYKDTLLIDYTTNMNNSRRHGAPSEHYEAFDPRCLVIAGDTAQFGNDLRRRKAFDLYRNSLRNVEVITFDELFAKTQTLINLLEVSVAADGESVPDAARSADADDEDVPF